MRQTVDLQIGDVVKLRSGGALMTIVSIDNGRITTNYWSDGRREGWTFPKDCLVLVDDSRGEGTMTRAELRASCPRNDTGDYIEWLEAKVLALTADEAPRHAKQEMKARWKYAESLNHTAHVREFMEKFEQHIGEAPGFPPQDVLDLRIRLMAEEFAEMLKAGGYPFVVAVGKRGSSGFVEGWTYGSDVLFRDNAANSEKPDFPAFIRELLDLEKVILGTHIACGVDPAEPWARVCAANLAKELRDGQPVKPEWWIAPDIAGALKEQGWGGGE